MDGGTAFPEFKGWKGVHERSATMGDAVRCLNVVFGPDGFARRPGRRVVANLDATLAVSRIFEHVSIAGSRQVLVGQLSKDPTVAPKVYRVPVDGGPGVEIAFPKTIRLSSPEAFFWAASYKGGHTIVSDPTGRLLDYDGETLSVLKALQGTDAEKELTASRAYLMGAPQAELVLTWRNRIVAVHKRTLGISADPGDMTVPPDAPASGANVWPASTNVDVLTQEGDEVIGAVVQADRLDCFLRRGVVVVDEDETSPIPRTQEQQYGCVAPRSVQAVGGGLVLYLSDGVVCQFDGVRSAPISDDISDSLSMVSWPQAYRAVSAHLARRTEYRLWLPLKGRSGNRLCVIYNYAERQWRVYAGEVPFDRTARWVQPFDVTAAATTILPSGEEVLLTGDSQGRIWREDVGDVDQGAIFPAYVAFASMSQGAGVEKFGDLRVESIFDGSWLAVIFAEHGNCLEQEITRWLEGPDGPGPFYAVDALHVEGVSWKGRLLHDDATGDLPLYSAAAWGTQRHTGEARIQRVSERSLTRRLQPIVLLPGFWGDVACPEPGGVSSIEFGVAPAGGRRG